MKFLTSLTLYNNWGKASFKKCFNLMIKIYDDCQSLRTITIDRVSDLGDFRCLEKFIQNIKGKHRSNPLTLIILETINIYNVI